MILFINTVKVNIGIPGVITTILSLGWSEKAARDSDHAWAPLLQSLAVCWSYFPLYGFKARTSVLVKHIPKLGSYGGFQTCLQWSPCLNVGQALWLGKKQECGGSDAVWAPQLSHTKWELLPGSLLITCPGGGQSSCLRSLKQPMGRPIRWGTGASCHQTRPICQLHESTTVEATSPACQPSRDCGLAGT